MVRLPLLFAVLALMSAAPALAGSRHQAEARAEVHKLLSGANGPAVLARLRYLGEERFATLQLLRALEEVSDAEQRRQVAFVLAGLGQPPAERAFLEFLTSDDSAIRMSGAQGLGRLRSRRSAALTPLLQDPSLGVRKEAARSLGLAHDRRLAKALVKAAKTEGEPEVREALLVAVGESGDKASAKALRGFLDDSSESTRLAAARGLCLLGDPAGFAFARKLLSSPDRFVRRQGVGLFEGLKAKQAAKELEPLLNDPDRHVAAPAARILYQGGDDSKLEWLVLASYLSKGEAKLAIEAELETLRLTDEERARILKKAGVE